MLFTAAQQLYRVMVNITLVYSEFSLNFIFPQTWRHVHVNEFCWLCKNGTLMANSDLEDVLKSAFDGVSRMLTGKNVEQNLRDLRMLCEEVLWIA